jgi:RNA polymerase sporulation-specific sigma factor
VAAGRPTPDRLLWARARAGDAAAREALITRNLNLVRHVVRRYAGMGTDLEDLFQVGCVGLIKAVDRFEPERGHRFSTYAVPVILGEIQRYLRDAAPAGAGRGALRLAQAARRAEERLLALGRVPTVQDVAAALGVSPGELALALEAARRPASLDAADPREGGDRPLLERIGGDPRDEEDRVALRRLLATLPPRERQVLLLRYYLDRSQAEVGRALGLSQPQISRLEQRALRALRAGWGAPGTDPGRIAAPRAPHTPG